jgi:tRNA 2-thiouridine synthesizing protein A
MDIRLETNTPVECDTDRDSPGADSILDITHEVCPMTYVRTRLSLDRLVSGQVLLVILRGDEPRRNVVRTALSQGHMLLGEESGAGDITRIMIRRA